MTVLDQVLLTLAAVMICYFVYLRRRIRADRARKEDLDRLAAELERSALEFGPFERLPAPQTFHEGSVILLRSGSRYQIRRSGWRKLPGIPWEEAQALYRERRAELEAQAAGISVDTVESDLDKWNRCPCGAPLPKGRPDFDYCDECREIDV